MKLLTDSVNGEMLEQGADHRVADHNGGYLEGLQLESRQPRALVVRSRLGEICLVELANFMEIGDETKSSTISLEGR
jgi:hypothetical protein